MMRRCTLSAMLVVLATLCAPSAASADIIVIDPEAYTLGTDLSDMFPELTMVARSNTGTEDVVVANTLEGQGLGRYWDPLSYYHGCLPPTSPTSCNGSTWKVLDLSFASPTNFVEIENTWLSDYGMILVLDQDNNILANCQTVASAPSGGEGCSVTGYAEFPSVENNQGTLAIQREQTDIARVLFGGWAASAHVEAIRYGVPEPATFTFVGLGLVVASLARRRSRRRGPASTRRL